MYVYVQNLDTTMFVTIRIVYAMYDGPEAFMHNEVSDSDPDSVFVLWTMIDVWSVIMTSLNFW